MVARSSLGAEGRVFEMDMERGKIFEFARAVLSDDEAHLTGDSPVIPPTFLSTTLIWEKRTEGANPWAQVQMSEERGMHAEQEFVFHGPPPRAGDRLSAQARITEIYDKQSRSGVTLTFVKMVTEFRNPDGELVAEAILTGVERQEPRP
ncbi:MAG: MaoC family dehydratase N-terminal domain-containing protein [Myxococcota bacterium]|jgi:hypothetical protein|nr:MaoC family dehydratase N-terminal domain-containing protein [Myxococcota bacterium]